MEITLMTYPFLIFTRVLPQLYVTLLPGSKSSLNYMFSSSAEQMDS